MARAERQPFRVYRVGGSVRDELLGREHGDRDWVVVGATPEMMTASGYKPVGSDFPVFLHPDTREEYALARTERKTAPGYHGFAFHAGKNLFQDALNGWQAGLNLPPMKTAAIVGQLDPDAAHQAGREPGLTTGIPAWHRGHSSGL